MTYDNTLLLQVPSAVVAQEHNMLINPLHPDMPHITIVQVEPDQFDTRLWR
jgi:hypothetical protein